MPLAAGARLNSYEVIALLGAGGMGEVYRARDLILKREAAIKVLPAYCAQELDRLRRFELEAESTAALNQLQVHGAETQFCVAPDGSPVFTRDIGTQEIYGLSVKWP